MQVYEIAGYKTGVSEAGVNFLQPDDSFQKIRNGYIYRQVLQSRRGISQFSKTVLDTRVMGIFEYQLKDNTSELLAISRNFLYKYNNITDTFDVIANAGAAPALGFSIASNEFYVSGTSYPDLNGNDRFVFTGRGMSQIYFYDGTDVKVFTNVADNPEFGNPASGTLTNGWYIFNFNQRLNIWNPTIAGLPNPRTMLYSGINASTGNGDKFSVVGSGSKVADTSDYVSGFSILGDSIIANFSRSTWAVDKTSDAFNPYFIRKIEGVLGTTAPFSSVQWDHEVISMGRTGIIGTDGRQTNRVDNKIPRFTEEEVTPILFDYTYGGFDRSNDQFMWSYVDDSQLTTQNKVLVSTINNNSWSIYDLPVSVFGQTEGGIDLSWDDIDETEKPEWKEWDTTEEIWDKIGIGESTQKTLVGDDNGIIYQLNQGNDDAFASISGITQASEAVLTISESLFSVNDEVVVSNVEGMTNINNFDPSNPTPNYVPWIVKAVTPTSVTINAVSTDWPAYTGAGSVSKAISFKAETIPFNPWRDQGRRVVVSHVEFLLDTNGGYLQVDVLADEETEPFKKDVLISTTSQRTSREWVTMSINQEANFITWVLKQPSAVEQVKITSMRIHCKPGGLSSG